MNNAEKRLSDNMARVKKFPRIQRKRTEVKIVEDGRY